MSRVSLKNLCKSYGSQEVIRDVNLEIEDGEFIVLVGPSGCGKSTMLRMIAGLESITSGDLLIGDKRVNDTAPRDRGIAMVFQSYALYPHMTSQQNMAFSLQVAGESAESQKNQVERAADTLGLGGLLDRLPKQLSGGQRQRVAMGRAIVRHPEVFLFDEPLSNLDAKLRVKMRAELKELHHKLRQTTIYVTHDQIEAMTLADRIVVLRDGKVEQVGAPLELYDNPVNSFVGTFLGAPTMNLFNLKSNGTTAVFPDGDAIPVPNKARGDVTVGIRPEALSLVDNANDHSISAEVVVVEPTGSLTEVVLRKAGNDITMISLDRLALQPGSKVNIQVDKKKVHVFATG